MTAFEVPCLAAINSLPTGLLYPHQADGVSFLISKGRAILGDDMGPGKTRQCRRTRRCRPRAKYGTAWKLSQRAVVFPKPRTRRS